MRYVSSLELDVPALEIPDHSNYINVERNNAACAKLLLQIQNIFTNSSEKI